MESCWNHIVPNLFPLKGRRGYIGYGCRKKHKDPFHRCGRRQSYRDFRKHGFDTSETWSLDYAAAGWLSDNVGGFFRQCGSIDSWEDINLDGDRWEYGKDIKTFIEAGQTRRASFLVHLEEFLNSGDREKYLQFITFIIPRLRYMINHTHGYPVDYENLDSWKQSLNEMIDKFKEGTYSKQFIDNFFFLWD